MRRVLSRSKEKKLTRTNITVRTKNLGSGLVRAALKVQQRLDADPDKYERLPTDEIDDDTAHSDAESDDILLALYGDLDHAHAEKTCGYVFLHDIRVQSVMGLLIVANAAVIGLETELPQAADWNFVENIFLLLFSLELFVKFCILGRSEFFDFYSQDFTWNLFDLFIVGLGVFDFGMSSISGGSKNAGFATIFRIVRLLRILRIFRIVKFLKQLYMLAFGLIEATKAVFWVALLMLFVLYVCAIVLVRTMGHVPNNNPHYEFLTIHFGSIIQSMLTLFVLMSSPNLVIYQDEHGLLEEQPLFCLFLVSFITFGSFGIIAMLTGVVNESMFEKNEIRKEEARIEQEATRKVLGQKSRELFETLAHDDYGEAGIEAVKQLAPQIRSLMEKAGAVFSLKDIYHVIEHMDTDGSSGISRLEFVGAMTKIAQGLSPLGIQEVHHELGKIANNVSFLRKHVVEVGKRTDELCDVVQQLATQAQPRTEDICEASSQMAESTLSSFSEIMSQHTFAIQLDLSRKFNELAAYQDRILCSLQVSKTFGNCHSEELLADLSGEEHSAVTGNVGSQKPVAERDGESLSTYGCAHSPQEVWSPAWSVKHSAPDLEAECAVEKPLEESHGFKSHDRRNCKNIGKSPAKSKETFVNELLGCRGELDNSDSIANKSLAACAGSAIVMCGEEVPTNASRDLLNGDVPGFAS